MRSIFTAIVLIIFLSSPLFAKENPATLVQIEKSGKIRIGYRQSHPPMSFMDKKDGPVGYSIDLCKKIVQGVEGKIGKSVVVEYVPVTAENRFDALKENRIDILCGATTKTLSRLEHVDFTELTFVTGASFMSLRGSNIKNNFDGKKIGVLKGTTTAAALEEIFKETQVSAEIVVVDSTEEGLAALEKGTIDAFSADQVVLIGLAMNVNDPQSLAILPGLFSYEPLALAVRRNDADFRLVANRVITELYRSSKIHATYDKWFGKFAKQRPSAYEAIIELNSIPE